MEPLVKPGECNNIQEIRDAIDTVDREILQMLSLRLGYVHEIVKFKSRDKEGIIAAERREQVLKMRRTWAEEMGLDGDLIEEVFRLLIARNIQIQFDINNTDSK
jgi:isochorismate pyruvate lyase